METGGELDIFLIEQVVWMRLANVILVVAYEIGWHPCWRQAVGFQAGKVAIWNSGIEMETEENVRLYPVGDGNPIREGQLGVVRAGHHDIPSASGEQRRETASPVQREILLVVMPDAAERAAIAPSVTGIDDDRAVGLGQSIDRVDHDLQGLLRIERVDVGKAPDQSRREPEAELHAADVDRLTADLDEDKPVAGLKLV